MEVVNVPAFSHDKIANEPIDTAGIPQPKDFESGKVPLVVSHDAGDYSGLKQVSAAHGRSYLLDQSPAEGAWTDRYGNPYSAITTKGNNLTQADFIRSSTAPSGFLPYGLQEGDALGRVTIASRIIREAGIDTEHPIGLFQPKQLVFEGKRVDVPDYKQLLVEHMVEKIKTGKDNRYQFTLEEVGAAAQALDSMDFFVTLRTMSTAARIGDLTVGQDTSIGSRIYEGLNYDNLSQIFRDYNNFANVRSALLRDLGLATSLPSKVDADTDKEVLEHYFSEILPKLMATNMGRLHSLGLLHGFPHENNFTALGGIVDLDSVRGKRLQLEDGLEEDDASLTDFHISEKTEVSFDALRSIRHYAGHKVVDWQKLSRYARENFTEVYMDTYDGSMSPADRVKAVFTDVAYVPGFPRGVHTDGSSLHLGSLERFYPGSKDIINEIEILAEKALSEKLFLRTSEVAWHVIDHSQDAWGVWGSDLITTTEHDENGELLINLGLPPTDQKILDMLPSFYDADEEYGKTWSEAAYIVTLLPLIKKRIEGDLHKLLDVPKEFLERLPGHKDVDIETVRQHLDPVYQEVLARLASKLKEPDAEEFWKIARGLFKERVLDSFDRSILPKSDFIKPGKVELEKYVSFWEYYKNPDPILQHVCSDMPAEQIESMLSSSKVETEFVENPDQLLQIEPAKDEEIRLVMTDGTINTVMHYEDYGGEFEDINYRQYRRSNGSVPTNSTVSVFLLQKGDTFRVVHKKLNS